MATKAIEVTLSDGRVIAVRELKRGDLNLLLAALPALTELQGVFEAIGQIKEGVTPAIPKISEEAVAKFDPLLASVSGLPVEEVADLGLFDWIALVGAASNFLAGFQTPTSSLSSPTVPVG